MRLTRPPEPSARRRGRGLTAAPAARHPVGGMSGLDNDTRVVVTGLGAVNSLGNTAADTWHGARTGTIGIGPLTKFDAEPLAARVASEVHDLNVGDYLERKEARRMDPFTVYAMVSAIQALRDAGLEQPGALQPERTGIMLGVGFGGVHSFQRACEKLDQRGPDGVEPLFVPKMMANSPVGQLAIKFGITGPGLVIASACTSATDAIGRALRCIRAGLCDVMITGGAVGGMSSGALVELLGFQSLSHYSGVAALLLVAAAAGAWLTARLSRPRAPA